jgi:hypothetical protein
MQLRADGGHEIAGVWVFTRRAQDPLLAIGGEARQAFCIPGAGTLTDVHCPPMYVTCPEAVQVFPALQLRLIPHETPLGVSQPQVHVAGEKES